MGARVDIEIYGQSDGWAQGRYLVHGYDDVLWTDSIEEAIKFLRISLLSFDNQNIMTDLLFIENWAELEQVPDSETHRLDISISDGNGWIVSKETGEHEEYLSTHTFYGNNYQYSTELLQKYGFNVQLKNWDE